MNRYSLFLFIFFISSVCCAQESDTLKNSPVSSEQEEFKLNKEALDAIRKGTLIGPEPERKRLSRSFEEHMIDDFSKRKLSNGLDDQDMLKQDSAAGLRISDKDVREMKNLSKVYHQKTTVDDSQALANSHITLSFNDILCYIFRPDLRAKMRNKKRAKAYKTYND